MPQSPPLDGAASPRSAINTSGKQQSADATILAVACGGAALLCLVTFAAVRFWQRLGRQDSTARLPGEAPTQTDARAGDSGLHMGDLDMVPVMVAEHHGVKPASGAVVSIC
mmetsp:Transcript_37925/g.111077  ORF Transcript_37925/g.111077 Transcript_37925/m.111077 type:complete len:111 (-) Transcript_37925:109-441(-)|eukprot:1448172-Prymnesium_polylepis.1